MPKRFPDPAIAAYPIAIVVFAVFIGAGGRLYSSPQASEADSVTTGRVLELLRGGAQPSGILKLIERQGGEFDLTVEDVVRLRRAGATPALILRMSEGVPPDESLLTPATTTAAGDGDLTIKQVMKMYRRAIPPAEIAGEITTRGLKAVPELDDLVEMRLGGVPAIIVSAIARGRTSAPSAPESGTAVAAVPRLQEVKPVETTGPLTMAEILARLAPLAHGTSQAALMAVIGERGIAAAPTLDEALALRRAGASQALLDAIGDATPQELLPAQPQPDEESPSTNTLRISSGGPDQLFVSSVPAGARVYVASARTRTTEAIERDHFVGIAPLEVTLEPGDWQIILSKDAGPFEETLLPAWRTIFDAQTNRSVLDDADLTFDPAACCLPGSLGGTVSLRAATDDDPRRVLGDQFDGLSPWLFDGESLQIARVRSGAIREVMKLYHLRKSPGQARLLVGTFLPAEGDPLDAAATQTSSPASTPDDPFDRLLDEPGLAFLEDDAGVAALAQALGFEVDHLNEAIGMLRRTGKALLHQQIKNGLRIVTLALDEGGRIRVTDQAFRPADPFTPTAATKQKASAMKAASPPPPLPATERAVIPGLGAPRLAVNNTTKSAVALLFSDGQFCFAPASSRIECLIDPGSFDVRVASPQAAAAMPQSRMHFSWHARYSITF